MTATADVVVIGAGIAGVSAGFHLAVRHGVTDVAIVDPRPPLTLTSDKSTECYRNWWPGQSMVGLMNRSIDIFEELGAETEFGLNRAGYVFVTAQPEQMRVWQREIARVERFGADADLLSAEATADRYPFLSRDTVGALRVPRAGWFHAQDLGQWMLDEARSAGARVVADEVVALEGDRVELASGDRIAAGTVVVAAGPHSASVAAMAGLHLPLFSELHLKVVFKDHLGVIPRDAPMTIWNDPQTIPWNDEERRGLIQEGRGDLLGEMPKFCHFRPEGGRDSPYVVALWEYHDQVMEPVWPLPEDPLYPEVVMRGLTTMVPGLSVYHDRLPESHVDGGYYTKTIENRPLIGPTEVENVYLMAGMSGFGVMVSAGAADLLARHIVRADLPEYASAFLLDRYDDAGYLDSLEPSATGQL